jgi:hypothetical protein
MIALVLIVLVMVQFLNFVIFRLQHEHQLQSLRDEFVLARVASVVLLLAETPVEVHTQILHAISAPPLRFSIASAPVLESSPASHDSTQLRQRLAALLGTESADIRIGLRVMEPPREPWRPPPPGFRDEQLPHGFGIAIPPPPPPGFQDNPPHQALLDGPAIVVVPPPPGFRAPLLHGPHGDPPPPVTALAIAVRLADGRWLNAVNLPRLPPPPFWAGRSLLSISLTALILSSLLILMVRRITRPLAQLAVAADRLGRGEAGPLLVEYGPLDIQETIRAFNHMRARLERFVQDRTRMLAAISHDLRTPLTALRVRAELIEEGTPATRCALPSTSYSA